MNSYKCLKQSVQAVIVTLNGEKISGDNNINNIVDVCPRDVQGFESGKGYHLCKEVCNQNSHAEVNALKNAKVESLSVIGASLYLSGHTYCCDNCISEMKASGISKVFIRKDLKDTLIHDFKDIIISKEKKSRNENEK